MKVRKVSKEKLMLRNEEAKTAVSTCMLPIRATVWFLSAVSLVFVHQPQLSIFFLIA